MFVVRVDSSKTTAKKGLLPSLFAFAYYSCAEVQRAWYYDYCGLGVDMHDCCEMLIQLIKSNMEDFYEFGAKTSMFAKAQSLHKLYSFENICKIAALHGHVNCLKMARGFGCPWDKETCCNAALNGRLDCLKYAHEQNCPWDAETCSNAALNGRLDCLKYAHEHNCAWDAETCSNAALKGHLNCLKYAHEHKCAWNEKTCSSAVSGGHLDCLVYGHVNGLAWDWLTCQEAVLSGHLELLRYEPEHGCPCKHDTCRVCTSIDIGVPFGFPSRLPGSNQPSS